MPYIEDDYIGLLSIPRHRRTELFNKVGSRPYPVNAGELNYVLTMACIQYLRDKGRKYQTYADIEAAFSLGSKEMYRRSTAPYEDQKIVENGDCYPEDLR
jgi:hypothetical protein